MFKEAPEFNRNYTHLGTQSQSTLEDHLKKVQNWVELTKVDIDKQHNMVLEIESYALKK